MTLNEVLAEVMELTGRPDKKAQTITAINKVISDCCIKTSFARDLVETSIPIDSTLYGDTIEFNNVIINPNIVRFRKFKYIKRPGVRGYLTPIGADKVFTPGGSIQTDVYYVGGNNITYIMKQLAPTLEIGYYQYPPVLSEDGSNNTHWTLDVMPYVIIDLAAARIFRNTGDETSAKTHEGDGQRSYRIHVGDHEDSILVGAR